MAVFFDEVSHYNPSLLKRSIIEAFKELKIDLQGKRSAFLKVNIVRPAKPNSGVVTHPMVTAAVIEVLRDHGIKSIVIGEGPAVGVDGEKAFMKSRYRKLAQKMGVELIDLHKVERFERTWDFGTVELPKLLLENDLYINLAKMKTHFHSIVTLGVKNQQGLLTPQAKKDNHAKYDLHQPLFAITKVIKPHITIIDGIESMEGEGPTKGDKKHTKIMVYGSDVLEVDIACCLFMGVDPTQVGYLNYAITENMANLHPIVMGDAFNTHKTQFILPSEKPKKLLNFYSWQNYRVCAEDEHKFEEALHLAFITPKYWLTFLPKFAYLAIFRRFDLIRGKEAKVPPEATHPLCLGECSREVAKKYGALHVPGCPPRPEDIIKAVMKMKLLRRRKIDVSNGHQAQ